MNAFFKDFAIGVTASLFATFLTTYAFQFIQVGRAFNMGEFLGIITNYTFLLYWMILLIFFILIRRFIRNRIDNLQTPFPMVIGIGSNYDLESDGEGYGFKWRVHANIKRQDYRTNEILDIHVGRVDGPYCKNDYREMKVNRTYFGRYKYKCPKCGYKVILLKNKWTLKSDIEDDVEAEYRNKINVR